jgi:uncharacterized RDD family membrane protein YckC
MSQIIETEETLIIETPERVPLTFALASIGNRFLAVAIDHFIQYVSAFSLAWFFLYWANVNLGEAENSIWNALQEMSGWTIAILIIIIFLIFSGYFVFFEWFWSGQTPGKRLMKLRVIREDGRPITFWEALARNLLRIFDALPGMIVPFYSVGLISIFLSKRDQRFGDMFAGTVVIRERRDEAPTFSEVFSNQISDAAFRRVQKKPSFQGDIKLLTEKEIEVVESFLQLCTNSNQSII